MIICLLFVYPLGCVITGLCVCFLRKSVFIRVGTLVGEVEDCRRVDGIAHEAGLEMEMRSCGATGATSEADGLASLYYLVFLYKVLVEVAIYGFKTVWMAYDDIFAISLAFITHNPNLPLESSYDSIIGVKLEVDAFMRAPKLGSVAVIGGDISRDRHGISRDIDQVLIGHFGILKRIDIF